MKKLHDFYDKTLAELNVPYSESYFATSFGRTHCLLVGDNNKPMICTIHGGNGITTLNLKLFLPLLSGDHRGQGQTEERAVRGRILRLPLLRRGRYAAGGAALGTPLQPHGQQVQRNLPHPDAEHHASRLPPYLLQQSGEGRHEPENAAIPDGAQRNWRYA